MKKSIVFVMLCLGAGVVPVAAHAQGGWLDRAKKKAQERIEKATDQGADKMLDKAESVARCAVDDQECIDKAKAEGKTVESSATGGTRNTGSLPAGAPPDGGQSSVATLKPGEGAWSNFDFVPGERVIFAEDFSRDRVGNFPRRLELVTGNAEVVEWQGKRWLRVNDRSTFEIPLPEVLPSRFTMEFDMALPWNRVALWTAPKGDDDWGSHTRVELSGTAAGIMRAKSHEGSTLDPRAHFKNLFPDDSYLARPLRVRIEADGRYMKAYLDQVRIANVPNAEFGRANKIVFFVDENTSPPLISNISVNAGGKDMYDALMSAGRIAIQGVYFDSGSDRVRPESSGQLRQIADMLREHGDLKLVIEGHTDNVGDAAANQTLSDKRAAAVKAALTGQYGVDGSRLTSRGFGATKPVAPNTTPEGRQQNRRVELVKG